MGELLQAKIRGDGKKVSKLKEGQGELTPSLPMQMTSRASFSELIILFF